MERRHPRVLGEPPRPPLRRRPPPQPPPLRPRHRLRRRPRRARRVRRPRHGGDARQRLRGRLQDPRLREPRDSLRAHPRPALAAQGAAAAARVRTHQLPRRRQQPTRRQQPSRLEGRPTRHRPGEGAGAAARRRGGRARARGERGDGARPPRQRRADARLQLRHARDQQPERALLVPPPREEVRPSPRRREGPPVGRGAERRGGVSRPRARGRGREPLSVEHLHHPPRHALPTAGGGGGGGVGPDGEAVAGVPPSLPGAHLRQHGEQGGAGDRPRRRRRRRRLHQQAHRALLDPRRGQQDGGRGQPPHLLAVRQAQLAGVRLAARPRRRRLRAARRRHHAVARRRQRVLHAVHVHVHEEPARARLRPTRPAPRRRRPPRRAPQVQPQREAAHVRDAHGMPRQRLRGDPRRWAPDPPAPLAPLAPPHLPRLPRLPPSPLRSAPPTLLPQ